MAEFSKLVITKNGQALMAKMIAGSGNIVFTKVSASSTQYIESQLQNLTSLTNIKQTVLVSKVTRTNEVAIKVDAAFSNAELSAGYYMRTLGLYAVDPDKGEILYAVTIETSNNCYIPPYNGITISAAYIQLYTTVGNAENVSLEVNSGVYATVGDVQELEKEIADLKGFVGLTDGNIYGVEVDFKNKKFTRLAGAVNRPAGLGFDSINAFGGRKRCNLTNDGVVVAYQGENSFSTNGRLTAEVTVNGTTYAAGTLVQTMVEQPKFYYKVVPLELERVEGGKGFHMRKVRYYVSDTKKAGFKLHPAFIRDGVEKNFIYLSAFEGCTYDTSAGAYNITDAQTVDWTNDLLASIAGAKPTSGLTQRGATRNGFRTIAAKRGTGWTQQTVQVATMTELLFLVEYASFDMQSKIGVGVTNKNDTGVTSMTELTGYSATLGNATGSVTNPDGWNIVTYRGEENFFGNIWKWIDGININNYGVGSVHIADHDFVDSSQADHYVDAGITICGANGYVSAFAYNEDFDWLFIASECSGNSFLPVGDYFYQKKNYSDSVVAAFGGAWNCGANAGGFCWFVRHASGIHVRGIGGRLLYVPQ